MKNKMLAVIALLFLCSSLFAPLFAGDKIVFSADRMSGSSGKKNSKTLLEGHASVSIGSLTITADKIELSGTDFRYVTATGTVVGSDVDNGFSFTSQELTYDRDIEVAVFRGNASLSDIRNKVETSAGIITYNRKSEVAWLQADVKLKKDKIDCTSGFALYRRALSMLELTGSPVVKRDTDEFRADRISVDLETEKITLDGSVSGTLKDAATPADAAVGVDGAPAVDGKLDVEGKPPIDGAPATNGLPAADGQPPVVPPPDDDETANVASE